MPLLICFHPGLQFFKQDVSRIRILHIQGLCTKQPLHFPGGIVGTHQRIHQGGMCMHHVGISDQIMEGCLHRWPQVFRPDNGSLQILLHLLFPCHGIFRIHFMLHFVQQLPGHNHKSVPGNGGQGNSTCLDEQFIPGFPGSIPPARDHIGRILTIIPGYFNQ